MDRLAGLLAVTDHVLLQAFLDEPDVMRRLDMLDTQLLDYIARVKNADTTHVQHEDLD